MSNKQQTAVEWLVEQLARKNNEFQALTFYYDHKEEIEQAKEMQKEQIIKAYENTNSMAMYGEQYYNETFNK